jgi:hypothetical protein
VVVVVVVVVVVAAVVEDYTWKDMKYFYAIYNSHDLLHFLYRYFILAVLQQGLVLKAVQEMPSSFVKNELH